MCLYLRGTRPGHGAGKTLGVPLQTQAVRLPVSSAAGEAVCLGLAGKKLTKDGNWRALSATETEGMV